MPKLTPLVALPHDPKPRSSPIETTFCSSRYTLSNLPRGSADRCIAVTVLPSFLPI